MQLNYLGTQPLLLDKTNEGTSTLSHQHNSGINQELSTELRFTVV